MTRCRLDTSEGREPSDFHPILRVYLVNDAQGFIGVICQNTHTISCTHACTYTQCQIGSPLAHRISDFPEERKLQAVDVSSFPAAGRRLAMIIKAHLTEC